MSVGCYSTDMRDRGEEEREGKGKREGREKDRKTGRKEKKTERAKGEREGGRWAATLSLEKSTHLIALQNGAESFL